MIMAPMADVTDVVFRRMIAKRAKPDVMYTEFVSADGLAHEKGRPKLLIDLKYSEIERPIVAQIFGGRPENIEYASALCRELGFDGIDINMGCPDRSIEKQGAGACMIKNAKLAQEVIEAAKRGALHLPISVKTRMGYSRLEEFDDWFSALLECDLAHITVHLRTRDEISKVPAHWELACKLAELRGSRTTLVSANGDVKDIFEAREKAQTYGLDGIMLGRAIFGNPWLFSGKKKEDISLEERQKTIEEHTKRFKEELGGIKNELILNKFIKAYQ